ncbi:MAG: hypothetical protein ABEI80_10530 [Haloplanus sp.]
MRFRDDRRAAALQVGAILLLGFLVIGLALYQSTVVPDQNRRVEFAHSQQVQNSLQELRNSILRTAAAERPSPASIQLGTRYPTRIVAVNPPPPSGRLTTEPGGNVTLVNASAVNDETADFWNGTTRTYSTRALSYRPDYNLYQAAPRTVYDDTVLYNQFDGQRLSLTDQRLLDGSRIYVVTLNGSLSRVGSETTTVSPSAVSASDRTVAINGTDLKLRVDTELGESRWERLLRAQYERNGGRIEGNAAGVTVTGDTLTVDLVAGTYRLRMAKVGIGTGVTDTTKSYLTVVDGANSVTTGGTRRIVLEVRDSYNNPVSGVTVNASVNRSDASIRPTSAVSDGQGRVIFEYQAPETMSQSTRIDGINFTYRGAPDRADFSGEEPESVRLNVSVVSLGDGSGGDEASREVIQYVDGSARAINDGATVAFVLRNTGSWDVNVTDIAVESTTHESAKRVEGSEPDPSVYTNRTGEVTTDIIIGEAAEPFSPEARLPAGSDTRLYIGPFKSGGGKSHKDMEDERITITLTFDDGTTRTYRFRAQ